MQPTDPPFVDEPWSVTRTLRDGTSVILRPMHADDKEGLRAAFAELSGESRYFRFFSAVTEPSEAVLRYLCEVDQRDHVAIVAVIPSLDLKGERGVGVARFVRVAAEPRVAEAAVTVVDDYQRKGLGTLLLVELARAAQARDVRVFRGEVLASNAAMLDLLRAVGARLVPSEDDVLDEVSLEREPPPGRSYRFEIALPPPEVRGPLEGLLEVLRGAGRTMSTRLRALVAP